MKNLINHQISRITYIVLLPFLFIGFFSCDKEKEYKDTCNDFSKIRKIQANNQTVEEIYYNSDCNVYENISEFAYKKYSYNTQDQLIKIELSFMINPASCFIQPGTDGGSYEDPRKIPASQFNDFEYDENNNLVKKSWYFINGDQNNLIAYHTYECENGFVKQMKRYNQQNELTEINIYTYDEKGNLEKDEYYLIEDGEPVLTNVTEFEYDDKINPYRIFSKEAIPGKYTNPNNVIKETLKNRYQSTNITNYSYEYDVSGQPLTMNATFSFIYGE